MTFFLYLFMSILPSNSTSHTVTLEVRTSQIVPGDPSIWSLAPIFKHTEVYFLSSWSVEEKHSKVNDDPLH